MFPLKKFVPLKKILFKRIISKKNYVSVEESCQGDIKHYVSTHKIKESGTKSGTKTLHSIESNQRPHLFKDVMFHKITR